MDSSIRFLNSSARTCSIEQEYEIEMRAMFEQLNKFAAKPGKAAIFRETGAQHFEKTGSFAGWDQVRYRRARADAAAPGPRPIPPGNEVRAWDWSALLLALCLDLSLLAVVPCPHGFAHCQPTCAH